ncbi:DUF4157 domain-containing protein [Streptomyces sp. NPDC051822]|uniref:DUF4157 domain-containing protein n=1 Tax=Streptomyces sp. NPDC051822 TaxID=3365675 RepID=UPI0037B005AE
MRLVTKTAVARASRAARGSRPEGAGRSVAEGSVAEGAVAGGTAERAAAVGWLAMDSGYPYAPPPVQREARERPEQHQHGAGCGHQQDVDDRPAVQRSAVHDVLAGDGRPLETPLREEMESRLGADFSDVRIHSGGAARASAAEIGARAYTSGTDVVLGDGGGDKHTLAHELTHVIQQRQGPVSGTDNGSGLSISDPSDRYEREAEANATRVMSPGLLHLRRKKRDAQAAQGPTLRPPSFPEAKRLFTVLCDTNRVR